MIPYKDFVRASSNYFSRASEDSLRIHYDLTLGCWVYFDTESTGVETGIISKWYETGAQRGYLLYKDASNKIVFKISTDGTTEVEIDDAGANYVIDTWFYVVGRFTPSKEMKLFVNGMWYSKSASIPATLYQCVEDFELGRYNRSNYLDGRISQAFLSAYSIPDRFICSMYMHAKALYMDKYAYDRPCSSSSTSSTSSSSSSSSTTSSSSVAP